MNWSTEYASPFNRRFDAAANGKMIFPLYDPFMGIASHILKSERGIAGRIASDDGCMLIEVVCINLPVVTLVCTGIMFIAVIGYNSICSMNTVIRRIISPWKQCVPDSVFIIKARSVLPFRNRRQTTANPLTIRFGVLGHEMIDGSTQMIGRIIVIRCFTDTGIDAFLVILPGDFAFHELKSINSFIEER